MCIWVCQMISGSRFSSILIVITTITMSFCSNINLENISTGRYYFLFRNYKYISHSSGWIWIIWVNEYFWKEDYNVGLKYQSPDSTYIWWMMVLGLIYFSNFPININTALIPSTSGSMWSAASGEYFVVEWNYIVNYKGV